MMYTIFVHPVNERAGEEKRRRGEEEKGRKHFRALLRINNREMERKRDKNYSKNETEGKKKKNVIILPK